MAIINKTRENISLCHLDVSYYKINYLFCVSFLRFFLVIFDNLKEAYKLVFKKLFRLVFDNFSKISQIHH